VSTIGATSPFPACADVQGRRSFSKNVMKF
jgi:hypothetical protein